ncbi:MAG: GTPase [Burkholderiaceae bacterium]
MSLITLVSGPTIAQREQAIADRLDPSISTVAILEGFPSGTSVLEEKSAQAGLKIVRIAAGCMCCTGNLVMRITLSRILRDSPGKIFLSITDASHLPALRAFLAAPPYDQLLQLTEDCHM